MRQVISHFFGKFQAYRLRPGRIIQLVRASLQLSSYEFAEKTGLTQTDVIMLENGKRPLSEKKLWMFSKKLTNLYPILCLQTIEYENELMDEIDPIGGAIRDLEYCLRESWKRENFLRLLMSLDDKEIVKSLQYHIWLTFCQARALKKDFTANPHAWLLCAWFIDMVNTEEFLKKLKIEPDEIFPESDTLWRRLTSQVFAHQMSDQQLLDFSLLLYSSYIFNFEAQCTQGILYPDLGLPQLRPVSWVTLREKI
ncbi:MAG: helix-turn-helix domain-containing protein [Desulfotomaculales bacterium]